MVVQPILSRAVQTLVKRAAYIRKDGTPVKATSYIINVNKKAAVKTGAKPKVVAALRRGR